MQTEKQVERESSYLRNLMAPITQSRHFAFLWLGQLFSILGRSITMVILPVVVYSITGSTVVMGLVMTFELLPNVLILPFSGLIVDRLNRVKLMMITDIVRFVVMAVAAVLILFDMLTIHILYVLVAVNGLMEGMFQPAYSALRQKVFVPKIRNAANALTQMSMQGVRLIGPALGGLIVSVVSAGLGFGIDAITFLISFVTLLFLRNLTTKKSQKSVDQPFQFKKDFMGGIDAVKNHPWLWVTMLAFAFINVCYGGTLVVLIPWLFNVHFQADPIFYGLAMAASGAGAIIAALLFGTRQQWHRRGYLAYGAIILNGVVLLVISVLSWLPGLVFLMIFDGIGIMVFSLIWETSLQELVSEESFGRVASLDMLGSFALLPIGYVGVGWLAKVIGGTETIMMLGFAIIVTAAVALSVPGVRRFD